MNPRIVRLTYVAIALVAVLVVMTTYWQTWAAAGLAARQDNAIKRVAEFAVDRGHILSFEPRKRLARNVEREVGSKTLYFRRYPQGPLTAHVVGYSTVGRSRMPMPSGTSAGPSMSNHSRVPFTSICTAWLREAGGGAAKSQQHGQVLTQPHQL